MFMSGGDLVVQSLLCSPYGHPAFTLCLGDATKMWSTVCNGDQPSLRNIPVKAVVTDTPWPPGGKEIPGASGYQTDINWGIFLQHCKEVNDRTLQYLVHEFITNAEALCGTKPIEEYNDKGDAFVASPTGGPMYTLLGDLEVLKRIASKAKPNGLKEHSNTPGCIVWERPRVTEKKKNSPESGCTFYMSFSQKVNDPILDWKRSEASLLPLELQKLKLPVMNYR